MSRMLRSCLSLVLCGVLALSLPALPAAGQTEPIYTPVSTKADLDAIRQNPSGRYRLTANIDFTSEDFAPGGVFYNAGAGWQPIGLDYANRFTGELDGNGYRITGLQIAIEASSGSVYAGLFGYAGGSIRRLTMADTTITVTGGQYIYAGAFAGAGTGELISCTAENSRITVREAAVTAKAGGLAGRMLSGRIDACHTQGKLSASGLAISTGGMTGQNRAVIENSVSRMVIDVQGEGDSYAGGIAGANEKEIRTCLTTEECCLVSAMDGYIGGITGWNQGTVLESLAAGTVVRQIAHYEYVGGIAGLNDGVLTASYYAMTGCTDGTVFAGAQELTDSQLADKASYSGWDFDTDWCQGLWDGLSVPVPQGAARTYLRLQLGQALSVSVDGLSYTTASLETYRLVAAEAAALAEDADAAECARILEALRTAYNGLTPKRLSYTVLGPGQVTLTGNNSIGGTVSLTATANNGAAFSGFCLRDTFYPSDTLTSMVSGQESAVAYFRLAGACAVIFRGKYGRVIDVQTVTAASQLTTPTPPTLTGYRFTGWNTDLKQLDLSAGCVSVDAVYEVHNSATRYTVTLIDAQADQSMASPLPFDTRLVLTPVVKPGSTFSHWLVNGAYAGNEPTYTLYVAGDDTVKAVYGTPTVPQPTVSLQPVTRLEATPSGQYTLSTVGQVYLPDEAQVLEYGMLFGADSRCTAQPESFTLGTLSYATQAVAASSVKPNRRYLIELREIPAGRTRYVRAYLIYKTASGGVEVLYSPVTTNVISG